MRWAVVALNQASMAWGRTLKERCESSAVAIDLFTLPKYLAEDFLPIEGGLRAFNERLFADYKAIIYVMAMGIIVRDIAPWLRHKSVDPAVLCYSVDGHYIIPVVSGHLGGANDLALTIADATGAVPVITTASDLLGKSAVDMMAKGHNLAITSYKGAKNLTAMLINGERVCVYSDGAMTGTIEGMAIEQTMDEGADGLIYIGYKKRLDFQKPSVRLVPRKLVLGMGCRKGVAYEGLWAFLNRVLEEQNIDSQGIVKLASIDLKAEEAGLMALAKKLKVPFITYSSGALAEVAEAFDTSAFVKKITGVGAVAMPSGYLASGKGRCLIEKVAEAGMTLCLWEEKE